MDAGLLQSPQSAVVEMPRRLSRKPIRKTRFSYAQASAPEFHQSNGSAARAEPCRRSGNHTGSASLQGSRRLLRSQPRRFGLGHSTGRDPGEAVRTYHEDPKPNPKTGTFYLAENRNFLFGSDTKFRRDCAGRDRRGHSHLRCLDGRLRLSAVTGPFDLFLSSSRCNTTLVKCQRLEEGTVKLFFVCRGLRSAAFHPPRERRGHRQRVWRFSHHRARHVDRNLRLEPGH